MIKLTSEQLEKLYTYAEKTYPEECCGLLLGKVEEKNTKLIEIWETENTWNPQQFDSLSFNKGSKKNRFSIAPEVILKAQKIGRDRSLSIIGIYHSHPDHPAIPSQFDQQIAWPEYSYIILSVQQGKVLDILSWKLDDNHQFKPEIIKIIT